MTREAILDVTSECPLEMGPILREFQDMLPKDLLDELQPMRDIQHAIDLVLRATLSNLAHYRMNLPKHAELNKQVDELMRKGFISLAYVSRLHFSHLRRMALEKCV